MIFHKDYNHVWIKDIIFILIMPEEG